MGMDIYGIAPKVKVPPPTRPAEDATKEIKDAYYRDYVVWQHNEKGCYFRATSSSWQPILICCQIVNKDYNLGIDMEYWDSNDGMGLNTQEECDALADALTELIKENEQYYRNNDNAFAIDLGYWTDADGRLVPEEVTKQLNEHYSTDNVFMNTQYTLNGKIYKPRYQTTIWHLTDFITFLRNSGGFEIW